MVDLKTIGTATVLASPTIPLQNITMKLTIGI
jgi:hypothetical protein